MKIDKFRVYGRSYAELMIHHIDVNMGDATLIIDIDTRKTLFIDAGNRSYGQKAVLPLLQSLKFDKVTYFVATHYDADHIGGFDELTRNGIVFETVYDRGNFTHRKAKSEKTDRLIQYGEYLEVAGTHRKILEPKCATTSTTNHIFLGQNTLVEIVAVGGSYLKPIAARQRKVIGQI